MFDLRELSRAWTVAGARHVFEQVVTQCVRLHRPRARTIRPSPGDGGVDTFVGAFGEEQHVWQAKYFPDGVGKAQKGQIREAWKSVLANPEIDDLSSWTLCVPTALSTAEEKWWEGWKKRQQKEHSVHIEIWTEPDFLGFSVNPELRRVFDIAFQRGPDAAASWQEAVELLQDSAPPLSQLPASDHLKQAVFVKKLELAGVPTHRARRTAFYNFELFREAIERGGTDPERAELQDLRIRVLDIWEEMFSCAAGEQLGLGFVGRVDEAIAKDPERRLTTSILRVDGVRRKGALYAWADDCEAGWTEDYASVLEDGEEL